MTRGQPTSSLPFLLTQTRHGRTMTAIHTYATVEEAILNASANISKLNSLEHLPILSMEGMSSPSIRHLLNNLCTLPGTIYSEIGTWKGSTLISALAGNPTATGFSCDNWSLFGGPKEEFQANCKKYIPDSTYITSDCDLFRPSSTSTMVLTTGSIQPGTTGSIQPGTTVYFYDGPHDQWSQYRHFVKASPFFADRCVVIIDDYNRDEVQKGTQDWLDDQSSFYIVYRFASSTPEKQNGCTQGWWNGIRILLLERK